MLAGAAKANDGGQWQLNAPVCGGTRSKIYELSPGGKQRLNPYYRLVTKPPGCAWDMLARGLLFVTVSYGTEKETY